MLKTRDSDIVYPRLILALLLFITWMSAHSSDFHSENVEQNFVGSIVDEQGQGVAGARVNLRWARRLNAALAVMSGGTAGAVSSAALGALGVEPEGLEDRFSWARLVTLAARTIRELATMRRGADKAKKKLPTLSIDSTVTFARAAQQRAFMDDLTTAMAQVVARHAGEPDQSGRAFRLVVGVHPRPKPTEESES